MERDCAQIINGATGTAYEHEYDAYLAFFRELAHVQGVQVFNAPPCWVPFIRYLGHEVKNTMRHFGDADLVDWRAAYESAQDKRRVVEMSSAARPELVHALYLLDTIWAPHQLLDNSAQKSFVVTCNGSFFRPEVRDYMRTLRDYAPTQRKAILVPCAAAKPYPAPLHSAVIDRLPDNSWDVIVTTGVLGLIPRALWDVAPKYDSGLPNLERVRQTVAWYFTKHQYDRIVVYSDFYAHAIAQGLAEGQVRTPASFLFGSYYRDTYENTLLPEHLDRLERELRLHSRRVVDLPSAGTPQ